MFGTRWARWAAGAGVLFVILFAISFFIASTPSSGDPASTIGKYYLDHKVDVNLSGLFTYLSVFVGAWFYVWLWRYFRSFDNQEVPATVALVGVVIFAASGALSAGFNFAFTDHTKDLTAGALVAMNQLQNDLSYPMTIVGIALVYAAAGAVIYRARAFPRWLAWVSWVLALASLVPPVAFFGLLAMAIWVLVISFLLWRRPASPLAGAIVERQPAKSAQP